MRIFSKIKAFFMFKGKSVEMELNAAKIFSDKIILHPTDDTAHAFCVKTKNIDIFINNGEELQEDDVLVLDTQKKDNLPNEVIEDDLKKTEKTNREHLHPLTLARQSFKKRRFSIMLYPEEYDRLMENINSNGYKKTEYFLACVNAAKKQNMSYLYNRYISDHKKRKLEERNIINQLKKAKEQNVD